VVGVKKTTQNFILRGLFLFWIIVGGWFKIGLLGAHQFYNLQTAATAKVQSIAVERLCDPILCICLSRRNVRV
jgi:hypothetical protein